MKICLISKEYPPETGFGGIGTYTYNLAHALAKLSQDVHIVSVTSLKTRDYKDVDVDVHRVRIGYALKRSSTLNYALLSLLICNKTLELIRQFKIDVVEAPLWLAESLPYSLFKIKPLVISLHTPSFVLTKMMTLYGSKWEENVFLQLEKITLSRADRILSSSHRNAELVCREYGIERSKVRIVPHGIDALKYREKETDLRRRLNIGDRKVVLFVGRLEKRKGVHTLVHCIPQVSKVMSDAHFILVGMDTDTAPLGWSFKNYILQKARDNGFLDHISMTGYISEDKLIDYYSMCDIFVAPSLYESFGYTYLEAMACSKPVVGTRVGGVTEVIEDRKTGILVPPGDSRALGKAILELLQNKEKRQELGSNARRKVEQSFSDTSMAKRTLDVFSELI